MNKLHRIFPMLLAISTLLTIAVWLSAQGINPNLPSNVVLQNSNGAANQIATYTGANKILVPATTLPTAAFPALTGDLTNSAGSLATTLSPGIIQTTGVIALSLADLTSLNTSPKQIIAAPGSGKVTVLHYCLVNLIGTTAFTGGGTVSLNYAGTGAGSQSISASFFTGLSANALTTFAGAFGSLSSSIYLNTAMLLKGATGNFAGGTADSGNIVCWYSVASGLS